MLAGTLVTCAYPAGEVIVGLVQWLTLDWRTLLRIVRVPFIVIVVFYWTMPESVRWLISKRRQGEAVDILRKIARANGTILTREAEQTVLAQAAIEEVRRYLCYIYLPTLTNVLMVT